MNKSWEDSDQKLLLLKHPLNLWSMRRKLHLSQRPRSRWSR